MHDISICVKLYRLSRQKYQPINLSHRKKKGVEREREGGGEGGEEEDDREDIKMRIIA